MSFFSPLSLLTQSPLLAIIFLLSIIAAITVHEFAHAWTADRLGDDTPHLQGRVSLNPAAHLDPLGSLVFLVFGFGWGKPVLYNPMRLGRKSDELLIALAGPASNLLFAFLLNIIAYFSLNNLPTFSQFLQIASEINVLLAAFNIIPIPPLDGSAIIAYFWPHYRSLIGGQIGFIILILILVVPIGNGSLLSSVVTPVENTFTTVTTLGGRL